MGKIKILRLKQETSRASDEKRGAKNKGSRKERVRKVGNRTNNVKLIVKKKRCEEDEG